MQPGASTRVSIVRMGLLVGASRYLENSSVKYQCEFHPTLSVVYRTLVVSDQVHMRAGKTKSIGLPPFSVS